MTIEYWELLWLVGSSGILISAAVGRRVESDARWPLIQPVAYVVMAVGLGMVAQGAAANDRKTSAAVVFVSAAEIALAAAISIARYLRSRAERVPATTAKKSPGV